MSWKGVIIGAFVGGFINRPFGTLIGAALGHYIEESTKKKRHGAASHEGPDAYRSPDVIFCASAAAMLAKMAKADGHVTRNEIAAVEAAFAHLGFSADARAYAIRVFRQAKDDARSIYEYAHEFRRVVSAVEVRELFYGLLWELARADGRIAVEENQILREIPRWLGIRSEWYTYFSRNDAAGGTSAPRTEDDYALLGVSSASSDDEVRRAYREKAKKYHPDMLKAQGLPDEMVGRATEQMGRINAAWERIKASRGMK